MSVCARSDHASRGLFSNGEIWVAKEISFVAAAFPASAVAVQRSEPRARYLPSDLSIGRFEFLRQEQCARYFPVGLGCFAAELETLLPNRERFV